MPVPRRSAGQERQGGGGFQPVHQHDIEVDDYDDDNKEIYTTRQHLSTSDTHSFGSRVRSLLEQSNTPAPQSENLLSNNSSPALSDTTLVGVDYLDHRPSQDFDDVELDEHSGHYAPELVSHNEGLWYSPSIKDGKGIQVRVESYPYPLSPGGLYLSENQPTNFEYLGSEGSIDEKQPSAPLRTKDGHYRPVPLRWWFLSGVIGSLVIFLALVELALHILPDASAHDKQMRPSDNVTEIRARTLFGSDSRDLAAHFEVRQKGDGTSSPLAADSSHVAHDQETATLLSSTSQKPLNPQSTSDAVRSTTATPTTRTTTVDPVPTSRVIAETTSLDNAPPATSTTTSQSLHHDVTETPTQLTTTSAAPSPTSVRTSTSLPSSTPSTTKEHETQQVSPPPVPTSSTTQRIIKTSSTTDSIQEQATQTEQGTSSSSSSSLKSDSTPTHHPWGHQSQSSTDGVAAQTSSSTTTTSTSSQSGPTQVNPPPPESQPTSSSSSTEGLLPTWDPDWNHQPTTSSQHETETVQPGRPPMTSTTEEPQVSSVTQGILPPISVPGWVPPFTNQNSQTTTDQPTLPSPPFWIPTPSSHTETFPIGLPTGTEQTTGLQLPTSIGGIQFPTSIGEIQLPTSIGGIQFPTSTAEIELPTSIGGIQFPTSVTDIQLPTSIGGIQFPTSTNEIDLPTPISNVQIPTNTSEIEIPTSIGAVQSTENIEPPTSTGKIQLPTSVGEIQPPTSIDDVQFPTGSSQTSSTTTRIQTAPESVLTTERIAVPSPQSSTVQTTASSQELPSSPTSTPLVENEQITQSSAAPNEVTSPLGGPPIETSQTFVDNTPFMTITLTLESDPPLPTTTVITTSSSNGNNTVVEVVTTSTVLGNVKGLDPLTVVTRTTTDAGGHKHTETFTAHDSLITGYETNAAGQTTKTNSFLVLFSAQQTTLVNGFGFATATEDYYIVESLSTMYNRDHVATATKTYEIAETPVTTTFLSNGTPTTSVFLEPIKAFSNTPTPSASASPNTGVEQPLKIRSLPSSRYFAGIILPTIIAILVSIPIRIVYQNFKLYQGFHALVSDEGARAADSLCLKTTGPESFVASFHHYLLGLSASLVVLSAITIPLSTEAFRLTLANSDCGSGASNSEVCSVIVGVFPVTAQLLAAFLILLLVGMAFVAAKLWRWNTGVTENPWNMAYVAELVGTELKEKLLGRMMRRVPKPDPRSINEELKKWLSPKTFELDSWKSNNDVKYGVMIRRWQSADSTEKATKKAGRTVTFQDSTGPRRRYRLRGDFGPFFILSLMGRILFLLVLGGLLIAILTYDTATKRSEYERGLSGKAIGVRFLFSGAGVLVTFASSSFFIASAFLSPYRLLYRKRVLRASSEKHLCPSTDPFSGIFKAFERPHRDVYLGIVAGAAILSESLPLLLGNIPNSGIPINNAETTCVWLSVGVLSLLAFTIVGSFFVDWPPNIHVDPSTIIGAMYAAEVFKLQEPKPGVDRFLQSGNV